MEFFLDDGEEKREVRILKNEDNTFTVRLGEEEHVVSGQMVGTDTLFLNYNGNVYKCIVAKEGDTRYIYINGHAFKLRRIEKIAAGTGGEEADTRENIITAPMPGKVLKIMVKEGDMVTKNQHLMILEAMKMENIIEAPFDGKIMKIAVGEGQQVMKGVTLIELEFMKEES